MAFRRAGKAAAVAVAVLGLIATGAGTATAGDNSGASVWGPQEGWLQLQSAETICPEGALCLYPGESGRHFDLVHCTTYDLHNWNGAGYWDNNQTGDQWARFLNSNHGVISWAGPHEFRDYHFDFNPVYFVKPC